MASKRKHSTLTLKDKLEVLKRLDKGEGVTKLVTEFNVGKATICDWRKNRRKLEQYCANSSGETLFFLRNIHRVSYTRAFGDEPRNFEPWSSDEDDTRAGTPLLTTTPHQREDVSALDRFNVHRSPTQWVLSGTGLKLVIRPATIRYLDLLATATTRLSWASRRKTSVGASNHSFQKCLSHFLVRH
ncbi:hypothetical protein TNCV_3219871 [Trichonephila clavipes]|nr:hypothetical protein TNCV_3219871 [Trichonephila clavipes]